MEVNPLSIILVKSDSKGDRLLFRYPFQVTENNELTNVKKRNHYALAITEDLLQSPPPPVSNIGKGNRLTGFTDEVLSTLFAVKPELCNQKFELKFNDVRFVGHPTLLPFEGSIQDGLLINIIFALKASASHSTVRCYYELSKQLGTALRYEERRCGYVSEQTRLMTSAHDDATTNLPEVSFDLILSKSTLARNLECVYKDLCTTGLVNIKINSWILLDFCLPQKLHQWHWRSSRIIEPEDITKCLSALRPYHGLLLLTPASQLAESIPLDGSPTLTRLLTMYSPLKSFQTLAADADLTLSHVFELTGHLVYWAKATVIYPLCASNKYVIAPDAPLNVNSPLIEKFGEQFQGMNLIKVISEFSLPTSLAQKTSPLYHSGQQSQLIQMMVWMLQHHLLLQLHTYVQIMPTVQGSLPNSLSRSASRSKTTGFSSSPKNSNPIFSNTNTINISTAITASHSRTESESGASTISDDLLGEQPSSHSTDVAAHSIENDISYMSIDEKIEEQLLDFSAEERNAIFKIPAANNAEDLALLAKLCRHGYFRGDHHLEEIMFLENLRRSQLLQLLDKFRDILITYETEDPAIAMLSSLS